MRFVVVLFIVLTIASAQAVAQSMSAKCPTKPRTIYLDSVDSTTNVELENELKKAKKLLSEGADQKDATKLRINVYSQPSWGTPGLTTVTRSVRDFAKSYIPEKQLVVVAGGHRQEASLDLFAISAGCEKKASSTYEPNPDMSLEEVDFPDAPLGLSVFPTKAEMNEIVVKRAPGTCKFDCLEDVSVYLIVDRDVKVMSTWPGAI
ncbi:MAG: hypothetical protein HKN33_10130, partial [Pyrinomonadaceae bacterium]|nr:hypothetical protein [Pyrinomonadaceae bacterium]